MLGTPVMRGSDLGGHAKSAGRGFEDRFADVMAVAAVVHEDVQVAQCVGGEGAPEFFDELGVEIADFCGGKVGLHRQGEAAAEIERDRCECFVHRQREVAVAADAGFVADRLLERLAEANASVFDGVVLVDFEIAFRVNG